MWNLGLGKWFKNLFLVKKNKEKKPFIEPVEMKSHVEVKKEIPPSTSSGSKSLIEEEQEKQLMKESKNPKIYAFTLPSYEKKGLIKVGYTERDAKTRIKEQTKLPEQEIILLEQDAITKSEKIFKDFEVHKILEQKGFERVNGEWFKVSLENLQNIILGIKEEKDFSSNKIIHSFVMRPEQEQAVLQTSEYFEKYISQKPKFLWNAKMRFGKTFASYQLAKKMGFSKLLILTYKPAVQSAWEEDLTTHMDFDGWQFINKETNFSSIDESKPFVWFLSFQDVLGNNKGKVKKRLEKVYSIDWDLCIIDEYHFGAWNDNSKDFYENDEQKDLKRVAELTGGENIHDVLNLNIENFLYLSGTPFRALNDGDFLEDAIFTWTYTDEQRAKENFKGLNNPYLSLPQIKIFTYKMPDKIAKAIENQETEKNAFSLNEFFKADDNHKFKYENEVQKWLDLLRGENLNLYLDNSKNISLPFFDKNILKNLSHTFWFLPNINSCYAMEKLLLSRDNTFYKDYKIIVCAGIKAGVGLKALENVKKQMGDIHKTKTITLSCGKLTTGVSIKAWSGIFMLRNLSSPETYFQSMFRVQTAWTNKNDILKKECYVFDFSPQRALTHIVGYNSRLDLQENISTEQKVQEFINFLPVLCFDGSQMYKLDAKNLLDLQASGISSSMLASNWQSYRLFNISTEALTKILENKEALKIFEKIIQHRNVKEELKETINRDNKLKKLKKEKGAKNLTTEEKKEDKDNKEQSIRKEIKEKLSTFLQRIPIFMYLTDDREENLKDIITELEPHLFEKVTGLTVQDFELLLSLGLFNSRLMNEAILAFKRFEEYSLNYADENKASKSKVIGLFDEKIFI